MSKISLRPEQIHQSDIIEVARMNSREIFMVMETLFDQSNRASAFHVLPITKALSHEETDDYCYVINGKRLIEEMGLSDNKAGYKISYGHKIYTVQPGSKISKIGQLHDTPKENRISDGYQAAVLKQEIGFTRDRDLPGFRSNMIHEYLPPQNHLEDVPVRPYKRKSDEEKAAERARPRKTSKDVTRTLPLKEAWEKNPIDEHTRWVMSGHMTMIGSDPDKISGSLPLTTKKGEPLIGADKKPVVIRDIKEAFDFVNRPDWDQFAAKTLFGVGLKTAPVMKKSIVEAHMSLNDHKFK